jgi:plastocyanin
MRKKLAGAALLAALAVVLLTVGPIAIGSAEGRQLVGQFCTNPSAMQKPGACIQLSSDEQTAQGYTDSRNRTLTLRPGIYWLTVTDNSTAHNFSLESPDDSDQDITGIADTPGAVTVKVNLTPGTWVLFCEPHRAMGMYVDIEVGGVGQVG